MFKDKNVKHLLRYLIIYLIKKQKHWEYSKIITTTFNTTFVCVGRGSMWYATLFSIIWHANMPNRIILWWKLFFSVSVVFERVLSTLFFNYYWSSVTAGVNVLHCLFLLQITGVPGVNPRSYSWGQVTVWTVTDHRLPPTVIDHHRPSKTITDHHRPSQVQVSLHTAVHTPVQICG